MGRESTVRDMLTEIHHEFHVSFVKITFKACQDILSVSTTCFSDHREMRVHFHGINKNIIVIYRVGLNSKLGHNDALSGRNEIAATSILFLNHWDQNKHHLWLPLWSEVLVARGLEFYGGPPFFELSPFPYPTDPRFTSFEVLEGKRKKRPIYFFLNWCRFPDGIRSYYWLRRNTCLFLSLVLGSLNLANSSLWISKQINKAFSVFSDTHYPFLLKLCQMQTPRAHFSSFCSV